MTKREKKTTTPADPAAELRAAMESGELPAELMDMAASVLDGEPGAALAAVDCPPTLEPTRDKPRPGAPAKLRIVKQGHQVTIDRAEGGGWAHETFGLDAKHNDLADLLLTQVVACAAGRPDPELYVNGILAAVHAEQPKTPVEAVLLVQAMIVNGLVTHAAERASTTNSPTEAARLAMQGASTTAKLVDCLQRVRGKPSSVQKVIVEKVEAQDGSQVIVGAVASDGSGGREGGK